MHRSNRILNVALSSAIVGLGHGQTIFIVDPGFPVPHGPLLIDLALRAGTPGFSDVFETVVDELDIESVIVAEELVSSNPELMEALVAFLPAGVGRRQVSHDELKSLAAMAQVIVRTGELTAYSNVALVGGVPFSR